MKQELEDSLKTTTSISAISHDIWCTMKTVWNVSGCCLGRAGFDERGRLL